MLTISFFMFGCAEKDSDIKTAVTTYDRILAEGYSNLNMNPLIKVATEQRASKAFIHMEALGRAGLKMVSKLNKINFLNVKVVPPDKADVDTEEFWEYTYNDIRSGKSLFANKISYKMQYKLIKKPDKWLVADTIIKRAAEEKDSSFIFSRPQKTGQQARH